MTVEKSLGILIRQLRPENWVKDPGKYLSDATPISKITSDSRQVAQKCVFVAVKGVNQDGHQFIESALNAGTPLVIGEQPFVHERYLQVRSSKEALAELSAELHDHPSHSLLMIGVTGTSGKTTTTYLIESILRAAGHRVGVIGTVNFRIGDEIIPSTHTTPGAVELQELLFTMRAKGCTAVVMEVSSHALKQRRTAALEFDGLVFTNLSPEHLDYHPDMEDYFASKCILFFDQVQRSLRGGKTPFAAINEDDQYGKRLIEALGSSDLPRFEGFRIGRYLLVGLDGIRGKYNDISFASPLIGDFNASNILAALVVCQGLGIDSKSISEGIRDLKVVPGRLEAIPNSVQRTILIDYAHKPDALEKVLSVLTAIKGDARLVTVFGCGGDRDRTKRSVMGKIASQLSDQLYVTSDNPRTEDPKIIIHEILAGTGDHPHVHVEIDRKKAIIAAIRASQPGDIVVIAGKGHEDYQIIGDDSAPGGVRKIHLDDREIALEALQFL